MIKSTHEGILKIGETEIPVAVLENGQRIITQSGVFQALDRPSRGNSRIDQIPTFMDAKNLQPYVNQDLMNVINKVDYIGMNGKKQQGYDANILPLVSDLYLQARAAGDLLKIVPIKIKDGILYFFNFAIIHYLNFIGLCLQSFCSYCSNVTLC